MSAIQMVMISQINLDGENGESIVYAIKPMAHKQILKYMERLEQEGLAMNMKDLQDETPIDLNLDN